MSNAETGRVLTNVVGIQQSKCFVKEKIPLSLEAMAVCFTESVGELCFDRFHGGFVSGQTENRNPRGATEKRK